jgi:hypothetical protein
MFFLTLLGVFSQNSIPAYELTPALADNALTSFVSIEAQCDE